jgi:modification methylase
VHLIVTSPPYWTLKKYEKNERQLGEIEDYNAFLDELDEVWCECARAWLPVEEFAASSVTFAFHADKAATA